MVSLPDGFTYLPDAFDAATAAAHLDALVADTAWETHALRLYGRSVPMPRLIAMYGPVPYRYSGIEHAARPMPERVAAIRARVAALTGLRFNAVLLNLYRDGRDGLGWHRDDDYEHGGQPTIASVSFGAPRRFQLRDGDGARAQVVLEPGSVLVMSGDAVARWAHRVPKVAPSAGVIGARVNLTFRHMASRSGMPATRARTRR